MDDIAYYTLDQAAKILQLSEGTIRRHMKNGNIPRAKFCGKVLIPAWFIRQGYENTGKENEIEKRKIDG